jgi:hypothetical protein
VLGLASGNLRAEGLTVRHLTLLADMVLLGDPWHDSGIEFRSTTNLRADGKIERSVFQETAQTPEEVQRKETWSIRYSREDVSKERVSYIFGRVAKPKRPTTGDSFFEADGVFASADKLPDHVVLKSPGLSDSKLVREATRTDLVFVTEYSWRETLTGVVTPAQATKAREDLTDLILDLGEPAVAGALGKDYDSSELFHWLRKDGKREAVQLLEGLDKARRDRHARPEAVDKFLEDRCKRWGIDPDKDLVSQLAPALARRIRDKGGRPVSEKTARQWLEGDMLTRILAAVVKAVEARPGGAQALQERVSRLSVKAFGLDPINPPTDRTFFLYTVTVPGVVIDTNGAEPPPPPQAGGMVGIGGSSRLNVVRAPRPAPPTTSAQMTVCWSFNRQEAHVGGYAMSVRSLGGDAALQQKLLKGEPLASREAAVTYRTLVEASAPLLNALRECRKQGTMQPLHDYRGRVGAAQKEEKDRVERVLKVLGLARR